MKTLQKYELILEKDNNFFAEEVLNPFLIEEGIGSLEGTNGKYYLYLPITDSDICKDKIFRFCKKVDLEVKLKLIDELDNSFLENYKKALTPVLIGDILIKPSWSNIKTIEIDPETAFGTGQHETTQLSIKSILSINDKVNSFIDVGTGSGILSIVAKKRGFKNIVSLDNDFEACKIAIKNFHKNNFFDFNLFCGSLEVLSNKIKFKVVVANIISSILLKLKKKLKLIVDKDGYLILSGILDKEFDKFCNNFDLGNFKVIETFKLNEWCALLLKKE
jgi:ribosomal protein L11 methyltransferase